MNSETRTCQNCKASFTIDAEDFQFYEKMKVPAPTWCPECRMIRRFYFYNEHSLFRRKDSRTNQDIFSGIPLQSELKVYDREYWNSDNWDPTAYGRDYDFSKPFFSQFRDLIGEVPWPSRSVLNLSNSDYSNGASDLKNAYLCFNIDGGENCAYIIDGTMVRDSFDLYAARHTELSYDNYMADESFRVFFSVNVEDCHEIWFSRNLIGCQNCFGCVNLRNKSYYIFNEPHTKEAYADFIKQFRSGSYVAVEEMKKKTHDLWLRSPMRFTLGINNVNSTGEHIEHSKNVHDSYSVHEAEDLRYCQMLKDKVSNAYDYTSFGMSTSLIYESCGVGHQCSDIKFSLNCFSGANNIEYSMYCPSSSYLFGCLGLRKKKYCIFNKEYSKEEYEKLRAKIIEHMNSMPYADKQGRAYTYGEFFPPEFSPFAYNETIAQDFFPLTKDQAEAKGYLWREPERRDYETTIDAKNLPDDVKDVKDDAVKEIIKCADCGKAYRIIQMELDFYRRIPLPIPRFCVDCRFKRRFEFVNPPKFWKGRCMCSGATSEKRQGTSVQYTNAVKHFHGENHCPNEFETSYAPGRPEIIYCEQCYQSEVV